MQEESSYGMKKSAKINRSISGHNIIVASSIRYLKNLSSLDVTFVVKT